MTLRHTRDLCPGGWHHSIKKPELLSWNNTYCTCFACHPNDANTHLITKKIKALDISKMLWNSYHSCRLLTQPSSSPSFPPSQIVSSASAAIGLNTSTSSTSSSSSSSIISPLVRPAALALRLAPAPESLGLPLGLLVPRDSVGPLKGVFFLFAKTIPLGDVKFADSL